jgi:hypothetical protein
VIRLVLVKVVHYDPHKELEDKVHSEEHKDVDIDGHELQTNKQTNKQTNSNIVSSAHGKHQYRTLIS